jgi:hypothetical protein
MKLTEIQNQEIIKLFNKSKLTIGGHDALHLVASAIADLPEDKITIENLEQVRKGLIEDVENDSFIDYQDAIKYLAKNDPSLEESMQLAGDFGYNLENIDSVKLADLHSCNSNLETINNFDFQDVVDIIKNN